MNAYAALLAIHSMVSISENSIQEHIAKYIHYIYPHAGLHCFSNDHLFYQKDSYQAGGAGCEPELQEGKAFKFKVHEQTQ